MFENAVDIEYSLMSSQDDTILENPLGKDFKIEHFNETN